MSVNLRFKYNPGNSLSRDRQAYEHYKLLWMLDHGYTIHDMLEVIKDSLVDSIGSIDSIRSYRIDTPEEFDSAVHSFENDIGFGGEIWPSFREFLDCEYYQCGYHKEET